MGAILIPPLQLFSGFWFVNGIDSSGRVQTLGPVSSVMGHGDCRRMDALGDERARHDFANARTDPNPIAVAYSMPGGGVGVEQSWVSG